VHRLSRQHAREPLRRQLSRAVRRLWLFQPLPVGEISRDRERPVATDLVIEVAHEREAAVRDVYRQP
jgi:hypothetical protein